MSQIRPSLNPPLKHEESELPLDEKGPRLMIHRNILSPKNFEEQGEKARLEYTKAVSGDPELSRFVSKISEIEKASSERSVSNYKAALDAIRSGDLETFARMPRPKRWRSRDGQDSELEDSRYPAFVFSR